eukprot:6209960-Pleurochrysis_carterae.AAC.1
MENTTWEEVLELYKRLQAGHKDAFDQLYSIVRHFTPKDVAEILVLRRVQSGDHMARRALGLDSTSSAAGVLPAAPALCYDRSAHQKNDKTKTDSLMAIKSYLSDLWRQLDQLATWTWKDAEKTEGFGNATLSRECAAVKHQSRRYDAHHGIAKDLGEALQQEDMVRLQVVIRTRLVEDILPTYMTRLEKALQSDEEEEIAGGALDLQSCHTQTVLQELSAAVLQSLAIDFDWQVGSRGFHRSETLNLLHEEFKVGFNGITDFVKAGKNRYEGRRPEEAVHHLHSGYGPFCVHGAKPVPHDKGAMQASKIHRAHCLLLLLAAGHGVPTFSVSTKIGRATAVMSDDCHSLACSVLTILIIIATLRSTCTQVLQDLKYNLEGWLAHEKAHLQGTCVVCATVIFNLFANAGYWSQGHLLARHAAAGSANSTDGVVPPPQHWLTRSRPQTGYFLPILKRQGRLKAKQKPSIWDA